MDINNAESEAAAIRGATDLTEVEYTHWAYFRDEGQARKAAVALNSTFGYDATVAVADDGEFLVRGTGTIAVDGLPARHAEVAPVIERHGGEYDGGEAKIPRDRVNEFTLLIAEEDLGQ